MFAAKSQARESHPCADHPPHFFVIAGKVNGEGLHARPVGWGGNDGASDLSP